MTSTRSTCNLIKECYTRSKMQEITHKKQLAARDNTIDDSKSIFTAVTRLMYERKDGKRCGKWYAMIGDLRTKGCKHKQPVTSKYVRGNFTQIFLDRCISKKGKYVVIPLGSYAGAVSKGDDGTPEVKYQQARDPLGKNAGVMSGLKRYSCTDAKQPSKKHKTCSTPSM